MQFKVLALITLAATAFAAENAAHTPNVVDANGANGASDACLTAWQNSGAMNKGATEETKNKAGCALKKCWGGQNWDQKTQEACAESEKLGWKTPKDFLVMIASSSSQLTTESQAVEKHVDMI
ncbi:hypothetical protein AC579_9714 [Pseudocercospora musae]|uniref:Pheromone n=1 Tax=Pseudocercospora musae TaxID=113226 RepID=A0A139I5U2_9PEZI|nr:hypothetical protein AC579_9714 [Pseudocercospora musae]